MFLAESRLDEHFGFDHLYFTYPIGRASNIALPKSRTPRKKFVQPCKIFFFQRCILNCQTSQVFNGWVLNTALYFEMYRSRCSQMFFKKGVLKNFTIFTRKHLCWSLFLVKKLYSKETPAQVFSCRYCGIFKNSYFYRALLLAA